MRGVLELRVEESLDTRKGRVIVENMLLADPAAAEAFRSDPLHAEVARIMSLMSDWWVADYCEEVPLHSGTYGLADTCSAFRALRSIGAFGLFGFRNVISWFHTLRKTGRYARFTRAVHSV